MQDQIIYKNQEQNPDSHSYIWVMATRICV